LSLCCSGCSNPSYCRDIGYCKVRARPDAGTIVTNVCAHGVIGGGSGAGSDRCKDCHAAAFEKEKAAFEKEKAKATIDAAGHAKDCRCRICSFSPLYYSRWKMQPIEFIAANDFPWWLANVIKYTCRYDAKGGLDDLKKAQTYLGAKIDELEGKPRFWEREDG
jgi:hypothetical protein